MRDKDENKPGPEAERLVIEDDWKGAVRKALKKKKPKDGWPDSQPKHPPTGDRD